MITYRSPHRPVALILLLVCCASCSGKESKARNLLIQARTMLVPGRTVELVEHLEMIVEDYPETEAAVFARQMLTEAIASGNKQAEMKLREAWATSNIYFLEDPYGTLDMEKLVVKGFKRDQEVILTVVNGASYELEITSRHVVGDRIYSVDLEGNVTSEANVNPPGPD